MLALPELAVVPIIGKTRWLDYLHYDFHLHAAPTWVLPTTGERPRRRFAVGAGGGLHIFWEDE